MIVHQHLTNRLPLSSSVSYVAKIWGHLDIGLSNFLLEVNTSKVK